MTVKLKQDRTRRSGYKGSLNAQDWPKEKQVLEMLALAQSNITNAEISLEIAAGCLKRAEKARVKKTWKTWGAVTCAAQARSRKRLTS